MFCFLLVDSCILWALVAVSHRVYLVLKRKCFFLVTVFFLGIRRDPWNFCLECSSSLLKQLWPFCLSVCTHQVLNLAFLIDGSASIKNLNSTSEAKYKGILKTVVDFYEVNPDKTNVAVAVYSSNASTEFRLDRYYSKSVINSTIDGIVFPGIHVGTRSNNFQEYFYIFRCFDRAQNRIRWCL